MKKFFYLVMLLTILGSCQKDEINPSANPATISPNELVSNQINEPTFEGTEQIQALEVEDQGTEKAVTAMTGYTVSPRFGKPNSTYYNFKVLDAAGTLALSVKLYDRATGATTYLPMTKTGSYWLLSTKISNNGCFAYNYVYSISKNTITTTNIPPYPDLWNSRNTFSSSGISSISWPFGADGSSWNNRTINNQKWRGGEETKNTSYHYGYGWDEGTHNLANRDKYADDWNRGTGTQDLGTIVRSPLDGYIDTYGTYNTSLGASKYISVIQQGSDGNLYRFYIGHLQSYPSSIYSGKYVRAGVDQIGILGSSGASSPHAHTCMRLSSTSVKFYFDAQ